MSRLTINSNISSLNAQRSFGNATKKLTDSYTRLSSGLRINRAADDAAGLSISESLKADTRIFNQGIRNLNDGISLLAIADGALGELSGIMIRLNELAEQSANGTLGNNQRQALDQEAQALSKEYNRIARTTEFNGQKLFNGDFGELSLVAGGGSESVIVDGLGGGIGDGTFNQNQSFAAGSRPTSAESIDFNNDGILDIVTAAVSSGGSINVLIGNGDGTFKGNISYLAGPSPTSISIADLNNDGILDVATSSSSGSVINILLGNGDGSLKSASTFATTSESSSIKAVDLNNDGKLDLVHGGGNGDDVHVLLGNGDGTFKARQSYLSGTATIAIEVGDFNGDNVTDIISVDRVSSTFSVLIGNSDGSFKSRVSYSTTSAGFGVTVGDLNNDGKSDLILAINNSRAHVFMGNGNGSFSAGVSYATNAKDLTLGDFDGDGFADLGVATTVGVDILKGNGDGTFTASNSFVIGGGSNSPTDINFGDFNNDGAIDLVVGAFQSTSVFVLLANSNDGVSALQAFSLKTQDSSRKSMLQLRKTLELIGQQRGEVGAFESRIEFAANNLRQSALAYSEANSRINDADIGEESAKLTAAQIIQQAASSILAQANQQPDIAIRLLEGL